MTPPRTISIVPNTTQNTGITTGENTGMTATTMNHSPAREKPIPGAINTQAYFRWTAVHTSGELMVALVRKPVTWFNGSAPVRALLNKKKNITDRPMRTRPHIATDASIVSPSFLF